MGCTINEDDNKAPCVVPLVCLWYDAPADGLPHMQSWLGTAESILKSGYDGTREPVEIKERLGKQWQSKQHAKKLGFHVISGESPHNQLWIEHRRNHEPCQARESKTGMGQAHITKGLGKMSVVFFAVLYTYYELKDALSRSELGDFRRRLCCTVCARNCLGCHPHLVHERNVQDLGQNAMPRTPVSSKPVN